MTTPRRMVVRLPDVSQRSGRTVVVEVEEPAIGVFAQGIPDVAPTVEFMCFNQLDARSARDLRLEWEHWADRMLADIIINPTWLKTPEKVQRLALDREHLSKAVMDAWGINRKLLWRPNFLRMVRRMSRTLKLPPTEILKWPTSDFWTNWYILFSPELRGDERTDDTLRMPEIPDA